MIQPNRLYNGLFICLIVLTPFHAQNQALVDFVNPLMGTDSRPELSNGNTYPAVTIPWGMNSWTPQTGAMGNGWQYQYNAEKIVGIKQTHQPSPWINDYGQFSIMPLTGKLKWKENERASWFSHKSEIAHPYNYSVYLADHNVTVAVTPTSRCAQLLITYPATDSAWLVIDAFDSGSSITIDAANNKIYGYTTRNSGGVPDNFRNYFVVYCSKPFKFKATWKDSALHLSNSSIGNHTGAVIGFSTQKGERVALKVASSFISLEQAESNLNNEIGGDTFAETERKAKNAWENELSKVKVEGGTDAQMRTFYSCLYRLLQFPRKFYEIDASGKPIHYSPYNGKVLPGVLYTDNGFWDTFRAVFPFFTLMYPDITSEIMQGLANTYKESGWLPEWASPGHRDCMVGSNSASLIADAYLKGIRGFDMPLLWEALLKNSMQEGPISSVGRKGVQYYNQLGYVPANVNIAESAARTLEYAYADYCLWQLAKALGRSAEEVTRFEKRSQNFRYLFDDSSRLMRGKNSDGVFKSPFQPFKWGGDFTEGNAWHYTWSVLQDVEGLKQLMGGDTEFIGMLDTIFQLPPVFDATYYGYVIHEIREMQIMGMGQYAHGNQPIQHLPYLYNYTGQPWKSAFWLRQIMNRLYHAVPDGYCGDEDNGQTSAWYVFSAMGFYPVNPVSGQFVIGSPLFKKVTLRMPNGKTTILNAPVTSKANIYIKDLKLNGKVYNKNWLSYSDLQKGGQWMFNMVNRPNKNWGVSKDAWPYSFTAPQ